MLTEGSHFVLVPEKVWTMLLKCYGMVNGQVSMLYYV